MKYVRLIDETNDKCERSFLVECWPENKEAAKALFDELLATDKRYSNYKWGVNDYSRETSYSLLSLSFSCPYRGWRLELINNKCRTIDMSNGGQMPVYTYFVVYRYSGILYNRMSSVVGEVSCNGNCEVRLNKPIKSILDIHAIEAQIDPYLSPDNGPCTITNYSLLDVQE